MRQYGIAIDARRAQLPLAIPVRSNGVLFYQRYQGKALALLDPLLRWWLYALLARLRLREEAQLVADVPSGGLLAFVEIATATKIKAEPPRKRRIA